MPQGLAKRQALFFLSLKINELQIAQKKINVKIVKKFARLSFIAVSLYHQLTIKPAGLVNRHYIMYYYSNHMPKRYRRYDCSIRKASSHGHYICRWETPRGRVYQNVCTDSWLYDDYEREIKEGKLSLSTVEQIKDYAREGGRIK